LNLIICEKSLS